MSGKHDRGAGSDVASLLSTGPILIRGLGRGVKKGLVPGHPSRHRGWFEPEAPPDPGPRALGAPAGPRALEAPSVPQAPALDPYALQTVPPYPFEDADSPEPPSADVEEPPVAETEDDERGGRTPPPVDAIGGAGQESPEAEESIPQGDGPAAEEEPSKGAALDAETEPTGATEPAGADDADLDAPLPAPDAAADADADGSERDADLDDVAPDRIDVESGRADADSPDTARSDDGDPEPDGPPVPLDDHESGVESSAAEEQGRFDATELVTQADAIAMPDMVSESEVLTVADHDGLAGSDVTPGSMGPSDESADDASDESADIRPDESADDVIDEPVGDAADDRSTREWTVADADPAPAEDEPEPDADAGPIGGDEVLDPGPDSEPGTEDAAFEAAEDHGLAPGSAGGEGLDELEVLFAEDENDDEVAADEREVTPAAVPPASVPAPGPAGGVVGAGASARPLGSSPGTSAAPRGPGRSDGRRRAPLRERVSREAVGIAVLVVLALVCAALIVAVVIKTRDDAAAAAREAAAYTPPPLSPSASTASAGSIAVLADSAALSGPSSLSTSSRWPAILGGDVDGTTDVLRGSGYIASGGGRSFASLAAQVPSDATVVIVAGAPATDATSPISLATAATKTFAALKRRAPDAQLIVLAPFLAGSGSTARLDALHSAARIADARWVDPVDEGWLGTTSGTTLSAADQRTIASKLRSTVEQALSGSTS